MSDIAMYSNRAEPHQIERRKKKLHQVFCSGRSINFPAVEIHCARKDKNVFFFISVQMNFTSIGSRMSFCVLFMVLWVSTDVTTRRHHIERTKKKIIKVMGLFSCCCLIVPTNYVKHHLNFFMAL